MVVRVAARFPKDRDTLRRSKPLPRSEKTSQGLLRLGRSTRRILREYRPEKWRADKVSQRFATALQTEFQIFALRNSLRKPRRADPAFRQLPQVSRAVPA